MPWLSPVNVLGFIYLLVYKLVFLDAVSGTLYIILQKIKLNWAQCPENTSIPLKTKTLKTLVAHHSLPLPKATVSAGGPVLLYGTVVQQVAMWHVPKG